MEIRKTELIGNEIYGIEKLHSLENIYTYYLITEPLNMKIKIHVRSIRKHFKNYTPYHQK